MAMNMLRPMVSIIMLCMIIPDASANKVTNENILAPAARAMSLLSSLVMVWFRIRTQMCILHRDRHCSRC